MKTAGVKNDRNEMAVVAEEGDDQKKVARKLRAQLL